MVVPAVFVGPARRRGVCHRRRRLVDVDPRFGGDAEGPPDHLAGLGRSGPWAFGRQALLLAAHTDAVAREPVPIECDVGPVPAGAIIGRIDTTGARGPDGDRIRR